MAPVLGLDIGGANLKAATPGGRAVSVAFPLWKQPEKLAAALGELLSRFEAAGRVAVTMTGELCDCFETKREGVNHILDAVEQAAAGRDVEVWGIDGGFHSVGAARRDWLRVAASNWHNLATFAGRFVPTGRALLVDIGSTTTDLIPLLDGKPTPSGFTDYERLRTGELVYTGVKRTPVMAVLPERTCAECFADMRDVHVVLGRMPESDDTDTADNRPATAQKCQARLARMLGGDVETLGREEILAFAERVARRQLQTLTDAVAAFGRMDRVLLCGSGEFLAERVVAGTSVMSLREQLGADVSECAPAYAVAVLSQERRP